MAGEQAAEEERGQRAFTGRGSGSIEEWNCASASSTAGNATTRSAAPHAAPDGHVGAAGRASSSQAAKTDSRTTRWQTHRADASGANRRHLRSISRA
jgi:hypothetical protein